MTLDPSHQVDYVVRFDEAGPDGTLRSSGYLRFAQHTAWMHSAALGFGREWYGSRGLTWLVRAATLDLRGEVGYGETLTVTTLVTAFRRSWARRRSRFIAEGTEIGTADTDWLLLGPRGAPVRIPDEIDKAFALLVDDRPALRVRLPSAPPDASRATVTVRPHELDPMRHVNNAVYLDWLEDGLTQAGADLTAPDRSFELEYALAAAPGALVESESWRDADRWCYRLTIAGREAFRATAHLRAARGGEAASAG